ncbi:ABC transporter substrate-binding protein [Notoacmeibacter ruber]|uniref:ABC transporter substrate-binding protein n=1 Tax=Notoacmeibacter ruber TaxID=2670375 RepID=A0A3L7J9F0_9HYPH|nr:ABC transporter substrate-binding protein [Notoacmeibacter ruber]RLQ87368.1 ABC transporter substrate-binding protein [Notoacmeibacter ruber]
MKTGKLCAALLFGLALAGPAAAKDFKFAYQGEISTLDPHSLNEVFTLGMLGNVYEGLTLYSDSMELEPGLAVSWDLTSPTTWNVKLREGVKFHEGGDFDADDVIFSWQRGLTEGSDQKGRAGLIEEIVKKSPYEIEIKTFQPYPILMQEMTSFYIMDKEWSEENGAIEASSIKESANPGYAGQHANGTGPFRITDRQPGVSTTFERFDGYRNSKLATNVTRAEFVPIQEPATRVSALISGEMDMIFPVPVQDWNRLEGADGVSPLSGPEIRTMYFGMDQDRDELLFSSVKGKNPFKDQRVREAFAHAINVEAIAEKVMRGAATPAGIIIAPQVNGFDASLNTPFAYDPERSKELLAEAGYPDGFSITLDCPNDRYVNDEKICVAAAGMLSKVGIDVDVVAESKTRYFGRVFAQGGYETSFYFLGWTPASVDAHNSFLNILACRDEASGAGAYNLGNYCNERVSEITSMIASEIDPEKRQALISEALELSRDDIGYIPLFQQPLSWGVKDNITLAQRSDDVLDLRNVVIGE